MRHNEQAVLRVYRRILGGEWGGFLCVLCALCGEWFSSIRGTGFTTEGTEYTEKIRTEEEEAQPPRCGFHFFRKSITSSGPIRTVDSNSPCFWLTTSVPSGSRIARLGTPFFSGI